MSVTIRTATQADTAVLARLTVPVQALHATQPYFKPPGMTHELVAHFEALLARPDAMVFIAEADGQPAGCAVAMIVERPDNPFTYGFRYVLLDQITVNPDQRRRGIGTALVAAVLEMARERGIRRVRLDVYDFNQEALAFYTSQGFYSVTHRLEIDLSAAEDIDAMG